MCLLFTGWALISSLICLHKMLFAGLLIFRGKKRKISRDFQGQIRGKIGGFRGIFAGKKSKLAEKLADFVGFSREKVKIRGKIRRFRGRKVKIRRKIDRFRGILAEKVKFRRIFRGKFIEKSADFTGKLRQETISKKQPISLGFFWQISLKTINFASI